MNELQEKLLNSMAVITTKMEANVCQICNKYNWQSAQGIYYQDLKHAKYRELDVSAIQHWISTEKDDLGQNPSITINILAEVKTMAGYHLIFDSLDEKPYVSFQTVDYCDWIGYIDINRKHRIFEIFASQGIDKNIYPSLVDKISVKAYPEDSVRIAGLLISPSQEKFSAGSFRETNTKTEKELDNSVLWKACQSLWSAIESFVDSEFENFLVDLDTDVLLARQENDDCWYESSIGSGSSSASLFHPVVVTSAQLWRLDSSGEVLENIDSTRLYIRNQLGHVIKWFDVVHINAFDSWLADTTKQYEVSLNYAGAYKHN